MADFLLEIGTEEIPARMLTSAWQDLSKRVIELLLRESLFDVENALAEIAPESTGLGFPVCATPRRLALFVPGIPATQPDVQEQLTGPATKVAYKDGQPTPAAHAFAKKAGVDVSQLQTVTTPKGEYLTATVTNKGKPAAQVLAEQLPKEIASIYWPKNMYWRAGKPERFVRPVRWIVALLDDEIIPLEFAGIKAGKQSRGHRILGPAQVLIASPAKYIETMQGAHVTAVSADREYKIRKALDAATRTVPDARWREDADLLRTVVNLTEWPSAILGSFDKEYLSLPEEVLVTVMRDHQKYFAVEDAAGKLAPHFLAVLNTDGDPDGLIRHGNERVLRARFNDARFFWDNDQKITLDQRVKMLSTVTFQKDLGSYYDKTGRVQKLATDIAMALRKAGLEVRADMVSEAARLSKTDLTTELVKEFTELQGIVGGLYAKAQALPQGIADAIYDQYKPESSEDSAPRTLEGAVLSIADKADSIAGMFALGLVPSGSKDPFALRRQANGIIKIIAEHKLPLRLSDIICAAADQNARHAKADLGHPDEYSRRLRHVLSGFEPVTGTISKGDEIGSFFVERVQFYLRDVLGHPYDVVNATLAAARSPEDRLGCDDVVDTVARAGAVAGVRSLPDFEAISSAFKRMNNILKQAWKDGKRVATPFNPSALADAEEKRLAEAVPQVAQKVKQLSAARQYEPALHEISRLRPAIDAFFDKVMVMVEDEELRSQRLGLLRTLVNEFSSIADFSEIVTEKK